jgi:DNA adenine methylase
MERGYSKLRSRKAYFGGKSRVAPQVWERFGDVANYVEPFAGSLAVLLGRPTDA